MKKLFINVMVIIFGLSIFVMPLGAAEVKAEKDAKAEAKTEKKTEKKKVKKSSKKKAKKAVNAESTPANEKKSKVNKDEIKLDELKLDLKSPETLKVNNAPADEKAPAGKAEKTFNRDEYKNRAEGYMPHSSDIQNLLASSNDFSLLVPKELGARWGVVLNYNYYKFVNEDKNSAAKDVPEGASAPDVRYWLSKKLENNDSYYLRLRYGRLNLRGDDLLPPNSKNVGPKIDMAYYNFQYRPNMNIRVGRQFLKVGRGFTYANIHDGLYLDKSLAKWFLQGFAGRTQPRESNVDQSNGGFLNRSYRDFYGIEADYLGISGKKLYGYVLIEKDGNVKIPYTTKDLKYDANYFGLGMEGSFKPNWPYYFEYVMQGGKTAASNTQTGTDSIKASAYYAGTEYYFQNNKMKPYLTLEYAHASGDPDRTSVTNTIGGNRAGTDDKNFMPWGIYDLGLALHPRFSNINAFKFGGFIKPFHKSEYFKEMQLGAKYIKYTKDNANGAISDAVATMANKNVGDAFDLYLTWRVLSDTLIYVNYGEFKPGDAYPNNSRDKAKLINFGTTIFF